MCEPANESMVQWPAVIYLIILNCDCPRVTQARIAQRIATIKQKVEAGETSETKYIGSVKAMRKYLVKVIETNRPGTAQAKNWLQHVDSEIRCVHHGFVIRSLIHILSASSDFEEHAAQQILNRGCEEQAPNPGYNMAAIATGTFQPFLRALADCFD